MTPRQRWILWGSLLAALAGLNWVDGGGATTKSPVVEALPGRSVRPAPEARFRPDDERSGQHEILALAERRMVEQANDPFAPRDWSPPPPPPAPAAAMVAPPLPFIFLGKKLEAGQWQVFLGRDERTYVVSENESLDELYRIESIRPPILTLRYLPMQQLQTLSIGEPN